MYICTIVDMTHVYTNYMFYNQRPQGVYGGLTKSADVIPPCILPAYTHTTLNTRRFVGIGEMVTGFVLESTRRTNVEFSMLRAC